MRHTPSPRSWHRVATLCLGIALAPYTADAAPFTPTEDAVVIEQLPRTPGADAELRRLRAALARDPRNVPLATALAQRYIERARADADPRYLGYAEAALAPWWDAPTAPAPVLLLRATIRQSNHAFALALADLDQLLQRDPRHAQAWFTRAAIRLAQGRYGEAKRSCDKLHPLAPSAAGACLAAVASVNGAAAGSDAIAAALLADRNLPAAERRWLLTLRGETAARRGDAANAGKHFRAALALPGKDSYLDYAYADFLLDYGRAGEVLRRLRADARADGALLRLAVAAQALRDPAATGYIEALRARFDASARRGDSLHQREHARFALYLADAPKIALRLAQANWETQREPADARILLEAALAADAPAAAAPVLAWMAQTKIEDARLATLAGRVRTQPAKVLARQQP